MPTRKIIDFERDICRHPKHNPPAHQVFTPGVYEHMCPFCKHRQTFTVNRPTL